MDGCLGFKPRVVKLIGKSAGHAPSLWIIPWHLPYNWGKARKNLSQGSQRVPVAPFQFTLHLYYLFWPVTLHLHFSQNLLIFICFMLKLIVLFSSCLTVSSAILGSPQMLIQCHHCSCCTLGGCCHHSLYAVVTRNAYNMYLLHRKFLNLITYCVVVKKGVHLLMISSS